MTLIAPEHALPELLMATEAYRPCIAEELGECKNQVHFVLAGNSDQPGDSNLEILVDPQGRTSQAETTSNLSGKFARYMRGTMIYFKKNLQWPELQNVRL